MPCHDPVDLESLTRDEIPRERIPTVEAHLAGCRECRGRLLSLCRPQSSNAIPHCYLVKEIGRGRFGVVYKAWWVTEEPKLVALKLLTSHGEMERNRFEREIAVLRMIHSPSVVKCLSSGTAGDTRYFIMDYVDGVHLEEYLARSELNLMDKLAVFQEVCRAVADAHATGVVHRDLKSRNILIDAGGRPHVLDFGICSVDSADWTSWNRATITQMGDVIGTVKYMSPEQAWGGVAGRIGERSDIWALGVMLHEIVTGDHPYDLGATRDKSAPEALLERIRKELPRAPRLDHLPRGRDLETLLERCLAWEPDERIPSARKLADDLQRYVDGRRIRTKPLRLPYRVKRLAVGAATRSRWAFSLLSLAAMTVILSFSLLFLKAGWRLPVHEWRHGLNPSASFAADDDVRENMVIVAVRDQCVASVIEYAAQQEINGVTGDLPTWRAVHAAVMNRLSKAGPMAVVWDYFFKSARPQDARLARAILDLEDKGIPVTLAAWSYRDDGSPDLSPALTEPLGARLRHGIITARDMVRHPGQFVTAVKRTEDLIIPSLALTTLAAVLHRDAQLDIELRARERRSINLLYQVQPGAYLRERDRLALAQVYESSRNEQGIREGDILACSRFELQKPDRWERRTVPYRTLLTCSPETLRQRVEGKVVVFGDMRRPRLGFRGDRHRVQYGTTIIDQVPGVYLLADAIAGLLEGRYLTLAHPLSRTTFVSMLLIGVAGCLMPIKLARLRLIGSLVERRRFWPVWLGLLVCSYAALIYSTERMTVHTAMAGISLLIPMAVSFWVEFARNRHQVLERNRRSVEDLEPAAVSEGTITLPSTRRTTPRPAE